MSPAITRRRAPISPVALVGALLAVIASTGCSTGKTSGTNQGQSAQLDVVVQALTTHPKEWADTVRYAVTDSIVPNNSAGSLAFVGVGAAKLRTEQYRFRATTLKASKPILESDFFIGNGRIYQRRLSQLLTDTVQPVDASWEITGRYDSANPQGDFKPVPYAPPLGGGNPAAPYVSDTVSLRLVARAAIAEIKVEGVEDLRGVPTTHFSVRVDGSEMTRSLPPELADQVIRHGDPHSRANLDVWVDSEGRLRRVRSVSAATLIGISAESVTETDLWDYGVELSVPAPEDLPS